MELTRHIDTASPKRLEITRLLAKLAIDLGIRPLAEGIENLESHQILLDMGFDLGQGYFYGKPAPVNKYLQAVP
jgi:EAL domain-containing protein (putative c-di-GMP-specific phosphodiesterase class I)